MSLGVALAAAWALLRKRVLGLVFFGVSGVSLSCELRVEPVFLGFRVSCSTMVRNGCGLKQ